MLVKNQIWTNEQEYIQIVKITKSNIIINQWENKGAILQMNCDRKHIETKLTQYRKVEDLFDYKKIILNMRERL